MQDVTSKHPYNNDEIVHVHSVRDNASFDRTCADTPYGCLVLGTYDQSEGPLATSLRVGGVAEEEEEGKEGSI